MKQVVIIGAGPAGITAAYELLKQSKEFEVVILEETTDIGGISKTVVHNGNRMDLGGHRFFSKNERVMEWWGEILPFQYMYGVAGEQPQKADPTKTDEVMLLRHRESHIYYKKNFFEYPISMGLGTIRNMGLIQTMKAGFSYLGACIHKLPEDSLENFYINRFGRVLYSMFFEGYTEKLWGRHPREISADWGAQRVKGISIRAVLKDMFTSEKKKNAKNVETSLIKQFLYPKLGVGQLWESAAEKVEEMGGRIIKNALVNQIHVEDGTVTSLSYRDMTTGENKEISGDYFLSSMPMRDLIESMGIAAPENVQRIAKGLPYRDFVSVGILLNKDNFIYDVNDCWIYVQDVFVKVGRVQIFNNWSPYLVQDGKKHIWIGLEYFCNEGDDFWEMPEKDCIGLAVDELLKMGLIRNPNVEDAKRVHVKKAYPAYFDTYHELDKVIDFLEPIENLYCVGRNGQHRYNNMDHSMMTSFEAVKNILSGERSKDNVWNVNLEKQYHEEKK